jgi:hypothetical protein
MRDRPAPERLAGGPHPLADLACGHRVTGLLQLPDQLQLQVVQTPSSSASWLGKYR